LILSGDVRTVKPDPEIFKLLIRRGDLDVRRTVFIDDAADNIATADQTWLRHDPLQRGDYRPSH
jgi:HAD superfamily hydrolase (TIGR01509 family)